MATKLPQKNPIYDITGQEVKAGQFVIITDKFGIDVGEVEEVYHLESIGPYHDYSHEKIAIRACNVNRNGHVGKPRKIYLNEPSRLVIVKDFEFLPHEYTEKLKEFFKLP